MDFWNDFSKTISNAADQTVKGTERLTGLAKLKYRISMLKSKLDDAYRTVGKLRYAEHAGETVTVDMYEGLFEKIADLEGQIRECEVKMYDLRDYTACPACGYRLKKGLNFCPRCGEKMTSSDESRSNSDN